MVKTAYQGNAAARMFIKKRAEEDKFAIKDAYAETMKWLATNPGKNTKEAEEFYENQIYDECFDYENEGFGPVCEDLDSAVNALCEIIENDCENKYIDRVDHFFVNHDKNNAKRILEAVLADDEKN